MCNVVPKDGSRILLLDADMVPCLTILRALKSKGRIDIAGSTPNPISKFSRYYDKYYQYPDPLTAVDLFLDYIVGLLEENQYDLIIPVTERSLIPLSHSSMLDPWRQRLAIADERSLQQVLDKAQTLKLAEKLQIPTPYSHAVSSLSELRALALRLDYPVVVKPGQSIPNTAMRRQLSVQYAYDSTELVNIGQELLSYCSLLIQQYVRGEGVGVELLVNQGEVVYAFQHQRLHELPLTGGGSCYRKSVAINSVLLEASSKLMAALNWQGVAMVEFKWQPKTGEYWLMEINGRFWGSLPLAVAAGADFPKMLFDMLVFKQLPQSTQYKHEVYCRKLSADLYWLTQVLRRSDPSRLVRYPSLSSIGRDCLFAFHPTRHYFDIQCLSDPVPGIVDIYHIAREKLLRVYEILRHKSLVRWYGSGLVHKLMLKHLKKAKRILFVCYGNINRSALAQRISEQNSVSEVEYISAGFHSSAKRPADPNMVSVADGYGVNLSNWQSTTLTNKMVHDADLIFAMEVAHIDRLMAEYPSAKGKSFLLGSLLAGSSMDAIEICDPYNKDRTIYVEVFNQIKAAVGRIGFLQNS